MNKIRVLVVDDSAFMRKMITDLLGSHPQIEVAGTARNGLDALEKINMLAPDVVTLDVEMPVMNGLEALKEIMATSPLPVLMLSSTTIKGAENTFQAMELGAVDFIAKPSGPISLDLYKVKEELAQKIILASKVKIGNLKHKSGSIHISSIPDIQVYSKIEPKNSFIHSSRKKILCIGTSTGGPRALQQVLTGLPETLDAPVLIVQHMPPNFTKSLAARLDSICKISVKEAEDGEIVQKGTAYIAPGGYHLKAKASGANLILQIDQSPIRNGHRPSVDVMFESVSQIKDYFKVAVIMTGMGSDGTEGLLQLKKTGEVKAIAESEETAVVYGMPKSAIATSLVDDIASLDQIAGTILKYI